jgi:hypothetical protein
MATARPRVDEGRLSAALAIVGGRTSRGPTAQLEEVAPMSPTKPPSVDEERGDWYEYRIYVINTLNSIQQGVSDVQRLAHAERAATEKKFSEVEADTKAQFDALDARMRTLEVKSSVYALLAAAAALLVGLLYAVLGKS